MNKDDDDSILAELRNLRRAIGRLTMVVIVCMAILVLALWNTEGTVALLVVLAILSAISFFAYGRMVQKDGDAGALKLKMTWEELSGGGAKAKAGSNAKSKD